MKTKLALTLAFLLASGLLLSGHVVAQDGPKDKAEYNEEVVKGVRAVLSTRKQKERDDYVAKLFARTDLDWDSFKEGLMTGPYYQRPMVTEVGMRHGGKNYGVRYRGADGKNRGFSLWLPKGYTAKDDARIPVLIYMHHDAWETVGQGATKAEVAIRKFRDVAEKHNVLLVAPYTGGGAEWWTPEGVKLIEWTLQKIKQRFNIDEDRVGLMGALDGADACWYVAQSMPGTFNVLMPMTGDPYEMAAMIRPIYLGTLDRMDVLMGVPGTLKSRFGDKNANKFIAGLKPFFDKRVRVTLSVQMGSNSDFHYLERIKSQIIGFLLDPKHKRRALANEVDIETDGPQRLRSLWLDVQGYDADVKPPRGRQFPSTRLNWPPPKKRKEPAKKLGLTLDNRDAWPMGKAVTRTALGASRASIANGDVLVKVEGTVVKKGTDLAKLIKDKQWNDEVELLFAREVPEDELENEQKKQRQYLQIRKKVAELKAAGKPVPHDLSELIEEEEDDAEEEEDDDEESTFEVGGGGDDDDDDDAGKPRKRGRVWFVYKRWIKLLRPEGTLIREDFGVTWDRNHRKEGVRVRSVVPGSLAARSGFKPGDVIVSALGEKIAKMADLRKAFATFKFEKEPEGEGVISIGIKRPSHGGGDGVDEDLTVRWEPIKPYRVDATWDKKDQRLNVLVRHAKSATIYLTDEFIKPGQDYYVYINGVPYQDLVDPATRPNYPHMRRGGHGGQGQKLKDMRRERAKIKGGWKPDMKFALEDQLKNRDRSVVVGAVLKLDFSAMKKGFEAATGHHKRPEGKRGEKLKTAVDGFNGPAPE